MAGCCRQLEKSPLAQIEMSLSTVLVGEFRADDGAVKDVEGCEQRGGAVTFVVVRHRPGTARLHRQTRLGAVERLDLALLVDREDDRMGARIDAEAADAFEFLRTLRVV